ncbi:histidine phosphatase family protein [Streptomyces sp. NPDC091281]|uniref:histidine phosphatase family protein n=1 Tax=Streptomyces sp. NPDC091281 TaxID=3365985 RepID=UPI00381A09A0
MRLLLVRHGETPSNLTRLLDTAVPGPGLTALGLRQAAALPEALAAEHLGPDDALYVSTLLRTHLTAAPLAAAYGLEPVVRDGVREIAAGDLELLPGDSPAGERYLRTALAWAAGDTGPRMPGGENGTEFLTRYDAVVAEAAASGARTAVIVSHGAAIRTWTAARARNVDVPYVAARRLANTGVVTLDGTPDTGFTALTWAGATVEPAGEGGPAGEPLPPRPPRPHGTGTT